MEMDSGDSPAKKPLAPADRRVPCSVVVFNQLTSIPGCSTMYTEIKAGALRIADGREFNLPMPFLDPLTRSIWIDGREYPLERVHYWERAKTAYYDKQESPPNDYVIGRRAKRAPKDI